MWATPTIPDRRLGQNDDYYAWVIGGCPNQDVRIVKNGVSSRIELSTPTFKFKEFEEVYFHAQVKVDELRLYKFRGKLWYKTSYLPTHVLEILA